MSTNDFLFALPTAIGSMSMNVAAAATTINPGEPVATTLGGVTVTASATNTPVVATDFWVGIAETTSTQTASAAGTVQVVPLLPGQTFLVNPKVAATWDTQTEYDALTGKRVLIDLTAGAYTVLAADGATNGLVVMPMLVKDNAGKVKIAIRNAVNYLS